MTLSNLSLPPLRLHCYSMSTPPPPLCQGSHIGPDKWDCDWQSLLIKVRRSWEEHWGKNGWRGKGRGVDRERSKEWGGVHERQTGWEAKGEEMRERECGMQSEKERSNVTACWNCCICCLMSLPVPKQAGLMWDSPTPDEMKRWWSSGVT